MTITFPNGTDITRINGFTIIDNGTRSGMEILAYSLKKNGVLLVGEETAGDVLAAMGFLLPDDSLLELAVSDAVIFVSSQKSTPVIE